MAKVEKFNLPDDLYYMRNEHIWAKIENSNVRLGLDQLAACSAGTVAYIKFLPVGRKVEKGRPFGTLEAGKYIGPLRSPVTGEIIEVNEDVLDEPELINNNYYGKGWFVVVKPLNLEQDIQDLVHGQDIQNWLEEEIRDYHQKDLLREEEECR